jgi:uncharacterized protein with HEPN domain
VRDDKLYLAHISQALARIERYIAGGRDEFMASTLIQDAVLHNLDVLGRSVSEISIARKNAYQHVPWADFESFQRELQSSYLTLEVSKVWGSVLTFIPSLRPAIVSMLGEQTPHDETAK